MTQGLGWQKYTLGSQNPVHDLNHSYPAAKYVKLGNLIEELIGTVNLLVGRQNAMTTALVAGVGAVIPSLATVTAIAAPTNVTLLGAESQASSIVQGYV